MLGRWRLAHSSFACFFGSGAVRELPRSRWHSAHVVFAFLPASGAFTCAVQPYGIHEIFQACTPLATYATWARAQGHSAKGHRVRVLSAPRHLGIPGCLFLYRAAAHGCRVSTLLLCVAQPRTSPRPLACRLQCRKSPSADLVYEQGRAAGSEDAFPPPLAGDPKLSRKCACRCTDQGGRPHNSH